VLVELHHIGPPGAEPSLILVNAGKIVSVMPTESGSQLRIEGYGGSGILNVIEKATDVRELVHRAYLSVRDR
jgi:hypothetical protein